MAFLVDHRRGGWYSFGGILWSQLLLKLLSINLLSKKFSAFLSIFSAFVRTHVQHAGGSVSQWETFLNHIIHILSSKKRLYVSHVKRFVFFFYL